MGMRLIQKSVRLPARLISWIDMQDGANFSEKLVNIIKRDLERENIMDVPFPDAAYLQSIDWLMDEMTALQQDLIAHYENFSKLRYGMDLTDPAPGEPGSNSRSAGDDPGGN